LAQNAANGQSILDGEDGLSKGMECRSLPSHYERDARHVARLADACSKTCAALEAHMRRSPDIQLPQEKFDQCNNRYDEFKAALSSVSKAAANHGTEAENTKRSIGDVVGKLYFRRGDSVLKTRNNDFNICGENVGRFEMVNPGDLQKVVGQSNYGSMVKLIGVYWTVGEDGRRTSPCLASGIELVDNP
jgi:hypothetical protein